MTLLVDIGCPDCGRKRPVRKHGLGRYYCEECDREFTQADATSLPDPTGIPDPPAYKDSERLAEVYDPIGRSRRLPRNSAWT